DARGAESLDFFQQARYPAARPRPAAEARETRFVDVYDRDSPRSLRAMRGPKQKIVRALIRVGEEERRVEVEPGDEQGGDEPPCYDMPVEGAISVERSYHTVISTRRLRGSATWSSVLTRRLSLPCDSISKAIFWSLLCDASRSAIFLARPNDS